MGSDAHKKWCCDNRSRGCGSLLEPQFDCEAALGDWETGWAQSKKDWCCAHGGRGCPVTTTWAYDCAGPSDDWQFDRRYWCCWNADSGRNAETGRSFVEGEATSPDASLALAPAPARRLRSDVGGSVAEQMKPAPLADWPKSIARV